MQKAVTLAEKAVQNTFPGPDQPNPNKQGTKLKFTDQQWTEWCKAKALDYKSNEAKVAFLMVSARHRLKTRQGPPPPLCLTRDRESSKQDQLLLCPPAPRARLYQRLVLCF